MGKKQRSVEMVDPKKLKVHPLNKEIYGELEDPEFTELIRTHGITDNLEALPDGTIIKGHRRAAAAVTCGIDRVPVVIRHDFSSKHDARLKLELILSNKHRTKTNTQIAREYEHLTELVKDTAAQNKQAGTAAGQKESPIPGIQNRADAAKAVGLSVPTAVKAAKVISKIDKLNASGKTKQAQELQAKLDQSIHGAAKELEPKKDSTPFDEPLAHCAWILEVAVPKVQDFATLVDRAINGNTTAESGAILNLMAKVNNKITEQKKTLLNAREKLLKKK